VYLFRCICFGVSVSVNLFRAPVSAARRALGLFALPTF
jgi:hypothetical protein